MRKAMQEAAAQQTGREDKDSCQIDESKYAAEVEKVVVEYIRSLEVEQPALYWGLVFAAAMHSIYQLEACVETIWNLAIIDAHKQDPEACWLSPEQRQPVLEQGWSKLESSGLRSTCFLSSSATKQVSI